MESPEITLNDALASLNPKDDANWTHDGLPRMDIVEKLMGDKSITRKDVTDADPEFCREVAVARRAEAANEVKTQDQVETEIQAKADARAKENEDDQNPQMQDQRQEETSQINPEEVLKAEIQDVAEAIEELLRQQANIEKDITKLRRHQTRLQHKTESQHSAKADTKARMEFIKSQTAQRAKRFEKGRSILAIIGKDGLNPQCKLDQAMRRKTQRGTKRPIPRAPNR